MLEPRDVVSYLQAQGYLRINGAALRDITIEDASRKNSNWKVLRPTGMCYFVKQARGTEDVADLAHEASIYQFFRANPRQGLVRDAVPKFRGYDASRNILVVEFYRKSLSLREFHTVKRRFPAALGSALGHALAGLHSLPAKDDLIPKRSPGPPWIFKVHRLDLRQWHALSSASLQVVDIVQASSEFCRLLDNLQEDWRDDTFIHFDAKWDNWIILEPSVDEYSRRVRTIDWELAGLGDACWDLGSVLADYLSLWRSSRPLLDETAPENIKAGCRLERMQPAIRAFWRTYVRRMQHEPAVANGLLVRTARFAAVRLLQIAVERAQISPEITSTVIGELQLSLNILRQPLAAIVHLFGIRLLDSDK